MDYQTPWNTPDTTAYLCEKLDDIDWGNEKPEDDPDAVPAEGWILEEFHRIREHLGLGDFEFQMLHDPDHLNGFVEGHVWSMGETPSRIMLKTSPNADRAEIAATLIHEFAHIYACGHDIAFINKVVDLAEAMYGAEFFEEARRSSGKGYQTVDLWIAVGIRAKFNSLSRIPRLKPLGEGKLARIVSRIQKMQRLAYSQPGTSEAIQAVGLANTMLAVYDLAGYQVTMPDARIHSQMADIWVKVKRAREYWRYLAASACANLCGCFPLYVKSEGVLHLFGRYGDLITAKYLIETSIANLERQAKAYTSALNGGKALPRGVRLKERNGFLDTAARALVERVDAERKAAQKEASEGAHLSLASKASALVVDDWANAQEYARQEHWRRGDRWRVGSARTTRYSEAGYSAGKNLGLRRGVEGHEQRQLTSE